MAPSTRRSAAPWDGKGILVSGALLALLPWAAPSLAQQQPNGFGQSVGGSSSRGDLLETGPNSRGGGSILDTTNPLDLMNRLRRATAMDDATPPGTAVDRALMDFDRQTGSPASAGGATQGTGTRTPAP